MPGRFETANGGKTWFRAEFDNAVNRNRALKDGERMLLHAVGVNVHSQEIR